jgi:molybdopterin-guanine dinucleotide biosynthesis protein A
MEIPQPPAISAYVLAGGRSSRMGTDKALLQLGGKPLIAHAVAKVRSLCADVTILSSNTALASYAPLLADTHPNCGPIGGLEAALLHSPHAWNLFLSVDMPFVPTDLLRTWLSYSLYRQDAARIHLLRTKDGPQPGLCLVHRDILPSLTASIARREYKLLRAFQAAAAEIATHTHLASDKILSITPLDLPNNASHSEHSEEPPYFFSSAAPQLLAARHLWSANLNTPEDFAEAEEHIDALDHGTDSR